MSDKRELPIATLNLEELKDLYNKSTRVVSWYAHITEVRGPFTRWFTVSEVPAEYKQNVSSQQDDARYAAAAMNNLPHLIEAYDAIHAENIHLNKRIIAAWDAKDVETEVAEKLRAENEKFKAEAWVIPGLKNEVTYLAKQNKDQDLQIQALKEDLQDLRRSKDETDIANEDEIIKLRDENENLRENQRWTIEMDDELLRLRTDNAELELELEDYKSGNRELVEVLGKAKCALQLMIIKYNGEVPGLTGEEVFSRAIKTRTEMIEALAKHGGAK